MRIKSVTIAYSVGIFVFLWDFALARRSHHRRLEDVSNEDDDLWSSLYDEYAQDAFYSSNNGGYSVWNNLTQAISENDPNFVAAKDVSVDAVVASLYFNALAFICLMIFYELLRRVLPAVYSSKKRLDVVHSIDPKLPSQTVADSPEDALHLPNERPLDWIRPVLGVPWNTVREMVGLDGYFFLRYIRMNVRITAVSTFWIFLIVVPIYFYGGNEASNLTSGWYRISAANLSASSNLMWVPCIVLYFFTGFIFFVIQQEYEHYFNIRQDFLAKGSTHVHPQHHYSVLVENIPNIYQSDMALAKYMESLFPDSVHSAVVVLNVPDLNDASSKCMRSCRRLEKSIAHWHATGKRPSHIVGRGRIRLLGIIDMAPLNCPTTNLPNCNNEEDSDDDDDDDDEERPPDSSQHYTPMTDAPDSSAWTPGSLPPVTPTALTPPVLFERRPARGTRVDSISYYTQELAAHSRTLFRMQQRKIKIANEGAQQLHETHLKMSGLVEKNGEGVDLLQPFWFDQIVYEATQVADQILDDSEWDNALITPPTYEEFNDSMPQKSIPSINTSSTTTSSGNAVDYGSISPSNSTTQPPNRRVRLMRQGTDPRTLPLRAEDDPPRVYFQEASGNSDLFHPSTRRSTKGQPNAVPFAQDQYKTWIRRWLGRLGLDFVVFCLRYITKQWEVSCLPIGRRTGGGKNGEKSSLQNANIMSRTGFVTFLDLVSTTIAASAPLNSNRGTMSGGPLDVTLAPEPREIIWENAHVPKSVLLRRERFANFVLALGVILWSFPLAAIQAIAKAENLAQIPGMEWIFQINGGYFTTLVNGYLPVVALLGLILILPVIFEYIAVRYERRKTLSDVQASMLGRYFYYQLANIYVTVTAGSVLRSLAEMIESPSSILPLLGKSIPLMVGYFVALLVTKTLAGLPMVFLRFGALMRMLLLLILSDDKKLTQRELDAIYRLENVQYGWEFPTQLLTVMIVFTYAVICPIILPFGLLYFMGALMVYKKQVLYVYSPVYESGGAMFPLAVQRSLFGLVCAQMTFWGYVVFRGCYYQPVFLFPLPILTVLGMNHLYKTYAVPSEKLSLERARECDRRSSLEQRRKAYREDGGDVNNVDLQSPESVRQESSSRNLLNHGIAARRNKFDKNMYRQPVLTENAAEPWPYRRGQDEDSETATVKYQLQQINRYIVSMSDSERKKHVDLFSPP